MLLQLRNIGMIKEADIHLNGLTVIAGENVTGKSTVGKALFVLLKARLFVLNDMYTNNNSFVQYFEKLLWLFEKVSKKELLHKNSYIKLEEIEVDFAQKKAVYGDKKFLDAIFIETPFIFNIYETLSAISNANSILDFEIPYNYLWWDLYIKLSHKAKTYSQIDFSKELQFIENIVSGKFEKLQDPTKNRWFFVRNNREYEMENVAMGIKQFAILYSIIKNGYVTEDRILVFDEPEVHLHPKWQIKLAELIIHLISRGVRIVVNSHSPYLIEALKRYSEMYNLENKTDFYLAEKGYIYRQHTLEKIFETLALPMRKLKKLKMQRFMRAM